MQDPLARDLNRGASGELPVQSFAVLQRWNHLLSEHAGVTAAVLALVVVSVFRGVLVNGFVSDDVPFILNNPFISNPHFWKAIFTRSLWSFMGIHSPFYRPLQFSAYWVLYRLFGPAPGAFHLLNLLLYAATVWVVYRLGRELLKSPLAAFFGALLWALHPLHVEPVSWISGLADVGAGFFYLLAFLLLARAERASAKPLASHVLAALAFLAALFFKEMAVSFIILVPAYGYLSASHSRPEWRRRALCGVPYLAAVAAYLFIRHAVLGRLLNPAHFWSGLPRVLAASAGLLGAQARFLVWPSNLNGFHTFDLAESLRSIWPWASIAVLLIALFLRRRQPVLSFLLIWWGVALLPVLDIRNLSTPQVAERFSYLPSVGPCLAVAFLAFVKLPEWVPRPRVEWPAFAAALVIMGFWAAVCLRIIPHWQSNTTLMANIERQAPNEAVLHVWRADVLFYEKKDLAGAEREYELAKRVNEASSWPFPPVRYYSELGLGRVAGFRGDRAAALAHFQRAAEIMPFGSEAYDALGSLYFPTQQYGQAAPYFQRAVQANPYDVVARFYLGTCWMKLGKYRDAAAQFHAARNVDPTYDAAYEAEAKALEAAGDAAQAARVRSLKPPAQP